MKITSIALYKVPYTEDDHHQPLHSILPDTWTPVKKFENIEPKLSHWGISIDLTILFDDVVHVNYAHFVVEQTTGTKNFYAWIDKIIPTSLQKEGVCRFLYHWDHWRCFVDKLIPLKGIINNRRPSNNDPPQYVPAIKETFAEDSRIPIINQYEKVAWIYLVATKEKDETSIARYSFPVNTKNFGSSYEVNDISGKKYYLAPSFEETINGSLLKYLKIEKAKIMGCCISSIPPAPCKLKDNQICFDYQNEEKTSFTIQASDLIVSYDLDIIARDNKLIYRFDDKAIPEKLKNELTFWAFPTEKHTFIEEIGDSSVADWLHYIVEIIPSDKKLFCFLQYLKFYSTIWNLFQTIEFNENEVYYFESLYWDLEDNFDPNPRPKIMKWTYTQKYKQDEAKRYIKKIERTSEDKERFDITLQDNTIIKNVGMQNILMYQREEPYTITYTGNAHHEYIPMVFETTIEQITYQRILIYNSDGIWPVQPCTLNRPLKSKPLYNLYLLDNAGYPINKFRQGIELVSYTVQPISQNGQMFILFRFNTPMGYIDNTEFVVHMTPIDMTQSYFNEYMLSLERDASNERRVDNIISSLVNLTANTAVGTLLAGPGGGVAGAAATMGKTLLGGALTTGAVGYGLGMYQQGRLEDRLQRKGSFLIRSGSDYSWVVNGFPISLGISTYDDYSRDNYIDKVQEFGIECLEIDNNGTKIKKCLKQGGPIKLSSVTLEPNMPVHSNVYIRNKLFDGVYLDVKLTKPDNKQN